MSVWRKFGPGLLFAGAAVGVSHLVYATQAGADYGMGLLWALVLIHLFKYPFFQFGPRYTLATGKTLLEGYRQQGTWVLWVITFMTLGTMFIIQAAITLVTASIVKTTLNSSWSLVMLVAVLLGICFALLVTGRYRSLDKTIKLVVAGLSVFTVVTVAWVFLLGAGAPALAFTLDMDDRMFFAFLIAFMGWMPAPLDLSIWHSLWAKAKAESEPEDFSYHQAIRDFNYGYAGSVVLAFCFMALGALMLFGGGMGSSSFVQQGSGQFISNLLHMFTETYGDGIYLFIALAAFTAMFSTTLTCLDALPRTMSTITALHRNHDQPRQYYIFWLVILIAGAWCIVYFFSHAMVYLLLAATIISFFTSPFIAVMSYRLMHSADVPAEYKPGRFLKILSICGFIFFTVFCLGYLYYLITY